MPALPKPEGWRSPYQPGHANPKVHAVIDVLDSWFLALQDGTAPLRLPDPGYQRSRGREPWTEAELEALVGAIDAKVDRELSWSSRNKDMLCDAGPGFWRLAVAQRLALAQQLDAVIQEYEASG